MRIVLTAATVLPERLKVLVAQQLQGGRDLTDERRDFGHVFSLLGELEEQERTRSLVRGAALREGVDAAVVRQPLATEPPRLLMMDVDSTLITAEVIDELAAHAGSGD